MQLQRHTRIRKFIIDQRRSFPLANPAVHNVTFALTQELDSRHHAPLHLSHQKKDRNQALSPVPNR